MAGTIVVDRIESDGSYASTINVASKVNFTGGMQIGGQDTTFAGMRNRIINGAMVIDQRNAGASVSINPDAYTLDRWKAFASGTGKFSVQQNAGSVTPPSGFTNYLGITSLAATTVGSTDYFLIRQHIEGYNISDLSWGNSNAQNITMSFWVRSSITGVFGGSLQNSGGSRTYCFTYTINQANTWEYKTIVVPGDVTGTWLTNNGIGVQISWSIGMGSTYSGAPGSWSSGNYNSATGSTNLISTNGATWYITGVQFEKGSVATPFEQRLYGQELALCQRYYFRQIYSQTQTFGYGHGQTTNLARITTQSPVVMRTSPSFNSTATLVANYVGYNGSVVVAGGSFMSSTSVIDYTSTNITLQTTASGVLGVVTGYGYSGYSEYSAEL